MMNCVVLVGRLTADPELRSTQSGVSVCSFGIAVDRRFSSGGERQADFIDCVAWRQTAEFVAKYFSKGKLIGIEGSIQTRNYEDKQGNRRKAVEVVAGQVSFVGPKDTNSAGGEGALMYQPDGLGDYEEITDDGDLPF